MKGVVKRGGVRLDFGHGKTARGQEALGRHLVSAQDVQVGWIADWGSSDAREQPGIAYWVGLGGVAVEGCADPSLYGIPATRDCAVSVEYTVFGSGGEDHLEALVGQLEGSATDWTALGRLQWTCEVGNKDADTDHEGFSCEPCYLGVARCGMRGWWLVFGAGLAACGGRSVPVSEPVAVSVGMSARPAPEPVAPGPASPPAEVTPWQPTESQEQLYRLLSVRDPEPSCSVAAEASATPALDLLALVDHAAQPPWVGMRAAGCLLSNHLDEVQEHVIGWMRTESTYGLALLTTRQLDALPEDVATAVVSAGLGGPADAEVRERAAQDGRASVRALVED